MAITADRVLEASNTLSQRGEQSQVDKTLGGLMQTPDFDTLGVSREQYYSMDEASQAEAVASAVNRRLSEEEGGPAQPEQEGEEDEYDVAAFSSAADEYSTDLTPPEDTRVEEPSTETGKANNLAMAAALKAYSEDEDFVTALGNLYDQGGEANSKKELENASYDKARVDEESLKSAAEQSIVPQSDNEEVIESIQAVNELTKETREEAASYFTSFVNAFAGPEHQEDVLNNLAAQSAILSVASKTFEDMGWGEKTWEFFRSWIPLMDTKDGLKFSGGDFDTEEFSRNFYANFQELGYEDRIKAAPIIQAELEKRMPRGKAASITQSLASPSGSLSIEDQNSIRLSLTLDAVDLIPLVGALGGSAFAATKGIKALKRLNKIEAADAVAVAARTGEPKAHSAVGLDEQSMGETLSPFNNSQIDPEAIEGLSNAAQQRILQFERRNQAYGRQVEKDDAFLRESFLTDEQAKYAERNLQLKYEKTDGIENVVTKRSEDGRSIELQYDVVDEDGLRVSETATEELTLNDVQEMEFKDVGFLRRHLGGALAWMTGDLKDLGQSFIRVESANARVLNDLRQLQDEAYRAILGKNAVSKIAKTFSPKQRKRINKVNEALLSGDEAQKVYTTAELKSGDLGFKLDDVEVETYFKLRTVLDNLHFLRNNEKRRELVLQGMKEATLRDGTPEIVRPLDDANEASQSVSKTRSKYVYDDEAGESILLESISIEDEYLKGNKLVRLDEASDLARDGNEVRYALVSGNQVTNLPTEVIHRRIGYVPKINNQQAFFAKRFDRRIVDGTDIPATEIQRSKPTTLRAFTNKKEAQAWVEEQNMLLREQGIDTSDTVFRALEDRQLELERTAVALDGSPTGLGGGGLYTGARSSEEVLWGAEGLKQPRLNSFEATARALTATAKYVSTNEMRLGARERVLKTANMLRAKDGNPLNAPFNSFDDLRHVAGDTENNRKIKNMYNHVQDSLGFPSTEESLFKQGMQNIINNSGLMRKMPGFEKSAFYLKSKDPIASARAAAFHGLLGWFNPVQLWVQGHGAAMALSMNLFNPAGAYRAVRNQFALQALQHVEPSAANIKHVAKSLGMSTEYLEEMNTAWLKSGLKDSVLTTADHAAAQAGSGVTMGAFRRLADKGLFFYRAGELFNRRLSFTTAFNEAKTAAKGTKLTDEGLRSVLNRSNDLLLNMNRANRASYQKGIWSLGTQFAQIHFRTAEALLGLNGKFTMAERGKILAGQAAFYGAAGIPLGNLGAHWLAEAFGYTQEELEKEVDPKTIKAINEGFFGWLTLAITGADIEIGDRSSLIGGLQTFTSDLLFDEGTISEKIFGAFSNVNSRFWANMLSENEPLSLGLAEGRVIDPIKAVASPLLSSISTFRNIDKAFFMANFDKVVDKGYRTQFRGPFSASELAMQAIGFQHSKQSQLWSLRETSQAYSEYQEKMTTELMKSFYRYALKSQAGTLTEDDKEEFRTTHALIMQQFNSNERDRVRQAVRDRLSNGKSALSKEWLKYRRLQNEGNVNRLLDLKKALQTPGAQIRSTLSGGGLMQEGGFEGQEVIGDGE